MLRTPSTDHDERDQKLPGGTPEYYAQHGPVVPSVTPRPIDSLIRSQDWAGNLGNLARQVIETQLETYSQSVQDAKLRVVQSNSLVDLAVLKIIESLSGPVHDVADSLKSLRSMPRSLTYSHVWSSPMLPYAALRAVQKTLESNPEYIDQVGEIGNVDVDEWIIRNERALRDEQGPDWKRGLIAYSKHAATVLLNSTRDESFCLIHRTAMSGYTFLDELRPDTLRVQPSLQAFRDTFSRITGGLLDGIDWSNVCVAGGIVLSSLVCIGDADLPKFIASDIDMYIYGLDSVASNRKVEEIFEVWKANLAQDAKNEILVVRNSRTITFFSKYPIKRVQIVLKLVSSPREVLLNFDLDQCAMSWDGEELWLLPRAARALETGYTVFTMNMIEGHYLGERRATQEQRVFKYADKGYGIRILPSYLDKLHEILPSIDTNYREYWEYLDAPSVYQNIFHLDIIAERASSMVKLIIHKIDEKQWATTEYDWTRNPAVYDDTPRYEWNEKFKIADLVDELESMNDRFDARGHDHLTEMGLDSYHLVRNGDGEMIMARRYSHGKTIASVLSSDLVIRVFIPPSFLEYANGLVTTAMIVHSVEPCTIIQDEVKPDWVEETTSLKEAVLAATVWRINFTLTWQLFDRRIDEVFEVLWSFYRSNDPPIAEEDIRTSRFFTEVSRRSIRRTPSDEFLAFTLWATRKPVIPQGSYAVEQGWWEGILEDDHDELEETDTGNEW